ncbi:MAG: alpha-amylase family protein [Bacteroidetes bacterium]|nr:alpha-amylase family protein [Bacteroidota bacterium]
MEDIWYKDAIFYAMDVESFQDSNGDGSGDFKGLIQRLDYLSDLGVTCLWLLPFYATPNRDNGYDVKDYYTIDPRLGSLEDFSEFVAAAQERNIRVIVDLVIHHTSNEHPWFQAGSADTTSKFHKYYIWQEEKPAEEEKENIFPGEEDSVWSYEKRAGAFYHHMFYSFMPDLNVANPEVQKEILSIIEFWLAFGIDGFRVDAATHLLENKGVPGTRIRKPVTFMKKLRNAVTQKNSTNILLAEADVIPSKVKRYFGQGDRFNMLFNFILSNKLSLALATEDAQPIIENLKQPRPTVECQWANFLRNLDELDLERLTDTEREKVYQQFAPKEDMRIFNRGIRRRLAPMLGGDRRRIEMAYSLLFSMPGAPVLIYGDEIGMGENLDLPGRTSVRTPMQWNSESNAGFSTASADKVMRKTITKGDFSYKKVNVETQYRQEDSLLNWMKALIRNRKNNREIGWGEVGVVKSDRPHILVHSYEWHGNALVLAHNLADKACAFKISSKKFHSRQLVDLFANRIYEPTDENTQEIAMDAYGYRWFRVNQLKS